MAEIQQESKQELKKEGGKPVGDKDSSKKNDKTYQYKIRSLERLISWVII